MKRSDDINYMSFFIKDDHLLKNAMKTEIKSETVLKTDSIESHYTIKSL